MPSENKGEPIYDNPNSDRLIGTSWWADLGHLPFLTTDERGAVIVLSGFDPAGQTIAPSFYEGWQAQRVIDAALVSHERGGWVEV